LLHILQRPDSSIDVETKTTTGTTTRITKRTTDIMRKKNNVIAVDTTTMTQSTTTMNQSTTTMMIIIHQIGNQIGTIATTPHRHLRLRLRHHHLRKMIIQVLGAVVISTTTEIKVTEMGITMVPDHITIIIKMEDIQVEPIKEEETKIVMMTKAIKMLGIIMGEVKMEGIMAAGIMAVEIMAAGIMAAGIMATEITGTEIMATETRAAGIMAAGIMAAGIMAAGIMAAGIMAGMAETIVTICHRRHGTSLPSQLLLNIIIPRPRSHLFRTTLLSRLHQFPIIPRRRLPQSHIIHQSRLRPYRITPR
jgi:hypothetical protein